MHISILSHRRRNNEPNFLEAHMSCSKHHVQQLLLVIATKS